MRKILFRGKRIGNGEWFYGVAFPLDNCGKVTLFRQNQGDGALEGVEVLPETVGQYTGLTDKNGKKIFENGYMIIDNKTYKVIFDNAEYILTNIFNCDIITLKDNSIKGVFVDEI